MVSALSDILGGLLKPLVLGVVLLICLGFVAVDPAAGRTGAEGFDCRGLTSNAEWNRVLCRYHPRRIWNTPVADLVPGLRTD